MNNQKGKRKYAVITKTKVESCIKKEVDTCYFTFISSNSSTINYKFSISRLIKRADI